MGLLFSKKEIDPERVQQLVELDENLRKDGHKQGDMVFMASNIVKGPLVYLSKKDSKGRQRVEVYSFDESITHDEIMTMTAAPYNFTIDMFCNILKASVIAKRVFLSPQLRFWKPSPTYPYPEYAGMLLQVTNKTYIAVGGRDVVHFTARAKIDTFFADLDHATDGVIFAMDAKAGIYTLTLDWSIPQGQGGPLHPSYFPLAEWERFVSPEHKQLSRIDQFKKTFMRFDDGAYFVNLHLLSGEML